MSIKVMSQVWESNLPSSEKFVLLALADHARDDGTRVYPSIRTVALKTGFSERTVQRQIRRLQALGLLSTIKKNVRYGTTEYLIRLDRLAALFQSKGDKLSPLKKHRGDNGDIPGVTSTTCRGDNGDIERCHSVTQTIIEPSLESIIKKQGAIPFEKKLFSQFDQIPVERFG